MARGAAIILDGDRVALIQRVRGTQVYYLFPGGGTEPGETPAEATVREVYEELGLRVRLDRLLAVVEFRGNAQHYFLASVESGTFGTGDGEEYHLPEGHPAGLYVPVWLPLGELAAHDVRPREIVRLLTQGALPPDTVYIHEG